jgi:hypothetical protein
MIKFQKLDFDNIFITSDLHLGHKNMCKGETIFKIEL